MAKLAWSLIWMAVLLWMLSWTDRHGYEAAWWIVLLGCVIQLCFVAYQLSLWRDRIRASRLNNQPIEEP